jgi:hypothetical protein
MRKFLLTLTLLLIGFTSFSQAKTEWKDGYQLSVLDFRADPPKNREEQGQTYYLAANLDFSYVTSSYESMRTKNFNKFVTAYFIPDSSWLQQGEGTEIMLKYAQMDFDLLELYARKYRKRLFEEKNALSNPGFFQQAHDKIMAEMTKRHREMQNAVAESDAKGAAYHEQILKEIGALAEFCKACKPVKKNK